MILLQSVGYRAFGSGRQSRVGSCPRRREFDMNAMKKSESRCKRCRKPPRRGEKYCSDRCRRRDDGTGCEECGTIPTEEAKEEFSGRFCSSDCAGNRFLSDSFIDWMMMR